MGLHLSQSSVIEQIIVCYQLSNMNSFITQVRLTTMSTPDRAWVIHDDGTDLQSPTPTCYVSHVRRLNLPFDLAAITLNLRLNFANTIDQIMMGAIGVTLA